MCSGLGDQIENLEDEKKKQLSKDDLGRVRKNLETLRVKQNGFRRLDKLDRLIEVSDSLYLMKFTNADANPRFYLTDAFPACYVILHAYKKKNYDEDPEQQKRAERCLRDLQTRNQTNGEENEHE
jgi:hypothetical protein